MIQMGAIAGAPAPAPRGTMREALAQTARQPRPTPWPQPDARWSLLMGCVSAYMLITVGRVHQLFPAVGLVRPTILSAALALVCVLLDQGALARLRSALRISTLQCQLGLGFWAFMSIPLALYPRGAFEVVTDLFKSLAMVLAIVTAVRGPRDVHRLAWVFFVSTAVIAIYILTHFELDQASMRYGKLIFYDANEFALLAVISLPFGVYAVWSAGAAWLRIVVVACMSLIFLAFVYCGSRGGTIALVVGLVFVLLRLRVVKLKWRLLGLAISAGALAFTASDKLWEGFDSVGEEQDYNITSPTGRVQVWKRGIGYMLDRPILGVGAGNFPTAEGKLSTYGALARLRTRGYKWSAAHNSYVQVGAELGIPGLLFFLLALYTAATSMNRVVSARTHATTDPRLIALAYACLVGILCFCAGAMFLSLAYSDMVFTLLAMAVTTAGVARRMAPRPAPRLA